MNFKDWARKRDLVKFYEAKRMSASTGTGGTSGSSGDSGGNGGSSGDGGNASNGDGASGGGSNGSNNTQHHHHHHVYGSGVYPYYYPYPRKKKKCKYGKKKNSEKCRKRPISENSQTRISPPELMSVDTTLDPPAKGKYGVPSQNPLQGITTTRQPFEVSHEPVAIKRGVKNYFRNLVQEIESELRQRKEHLENVIIPAVLADEKPETGEDGDKFSAFIRESNRVIADFKQRGVDFDKQKVLQQAKENYLRKIQDEKMEQAREATEKYKKELWDQYRTDVAKFGGKQEAPWD